MSLRRLAGLWGPVLLEAALLFYLSSLRSMVLPVARGWDKVAHFVAYGLLAVLVTRALHGGWVPLRFRLVLGAIALATLYGASDEFHQRFVPGRDASLFDLAADFLGAVAATGMLAVVLAKTRGAPDVYSPPFAGG